MRQRVINKDLPVDTTPNPVGSAEVYTSKKVVVLAASCLGLALIVAHATHYVSGSLMLGLTSYPLTWLLLVAALSALAFRRKVSWKIVTLSLVFLGTALILAHLVRLASGSLVPALVAYPILWLLMLSIMGLQGRAATKSEKSR